MVGQCVSEVFDLPARASWSVSTSEMPSCAAIFATGHDTFSYPVTLATHATADWVAQNTDKNSAMSWANTVEVSASGGVADPTKPAHSDAATAGCG